MFYKIIYGPYMQSTTGRGFISMHHFFKTFAKFETKTAFFEVKINKFHFFLNLYLICKIPVKLMFYLDTIINFSRIEWENALGNVFSFFHHSLQTLNICSSIVCHNFCFCTLCGLSILTFDTEKLKGYNCIIYGWGSR